VSVQTRSDEQQQQKSFFGQPPVLANLFGVELWERFSFYGMQGILLIYLYYGAAEGGLGMDKATAAGIVGAYGGLVYLSTILGAWVADRVLGSERTLFYSAVVIMLGHIALALLPGFLGVGAGLLLVGRVGPLDVELPDPSGEALSLPPRPEADLTAEESDRLAELVSGARGAVVLGGSPDDVTDVADWWSGTLGWPVLAEPVSNARMPGTALLAGQGLIADGVWSAGHHPDLVIQLGAAPTTRATQAFVASAERLIVADRWHLDPDPERAATWRLAVDADVLTDALQGRPVHVLAAPEEWTSSWADADRKARGALDGFLDAIDEPFEPRIARDVAASVPGNGMVFVGNSTPVRDLDLAMAPRAGLRVLANRGASGVDGLVSTALGVAAAGQGPTVALLGDLSYLYDVGTIVWNARRGVEATLVIVNNGGGEVFSLLPQRELPEHRDLFVTPHGTDLGALTRAAGAGHTLVERANELTPAVLAAIGSGGLQVVEVTVDAEHSMVRRAELRSAIASGLA